MFARPACVTIWAMASTSKSAALPERVRAFVEESVRRARLRRSERPWAADLLIQECAAALAAGATEQDVIARVGPVAAAARRVRRRAFKQRGIGWRMWFVASRCAAAVFVACVCVYGFFFIRTSGDAPTIKHNYWADLNAAALAAPEADKAEPLYLDALNRLHAAPEWKRVSDAIRDNEGGAYQQDVVRRFLTENQAALDIVRRAASRPVLGTVLSTAEVSKWSEIANGPDGGAAEDEETNPLLAECKLPHLGPLRTIARLLAADMAMAASDADGTRWLADARALAGVAKHTAKGGALVQGLSGYLAGYKLIDRVNADLARPSLLTDAQLAELDQLLAKGEYQRGPGEIESDLTGELMQSADFVQRVYTDDGSGDGAFMFVHWDECMSKLDGASLSSVGERWARGPGRRLITPLAAVWQVGRKDTLEGMNAWGELYHRLRRMPLTTAANDRSADELLRSIAHEDAWIVQKLRGLGAPRRAAVFDVFCFGAARVAAVERRLEQRRDAARVLVAVCRFQAREGRWPASLNELVPGLLGTVPVDVFDDKPLKYRLTPSGPVNYSVGVDGVDDGGTPPTGVASPEEVDNVLLFRKPEARVFRGFDCVFYPAPPRVAPK